MKKGNGFSLNDFDLDIEKSMGSGGSIEPNWKSKSLCTPGCITGVLQGCFLKTLTCGCHIGFGEGK